MSKDGIYFRQLKSNFCLMLKIHASLVHKIDPSQIMVCLLSFWIHFNVYFGNSKSFLNSRNDTCNNGINNYAPR